MTHHFTCRYFNATPHASHPDASLFSLISRMSTISSQRSGAYDSHLDLIRLPNDPHMLIEVKRMAERVYTSRLRYVIVIGIGGSSLGTEAVYHALRGTLDALSEHLPKLIVLDTLSSLQLTGLDEILLAGNVFPDELLINIVSKSGTTTETISNAEYVLDMLTKRVGDISSRVVVTTDHGSPLWISAHERGYGQLAIPKHVGGRFSVFTPVGLFPLMLCGIDVVELLHGGAVMLEQEFGSDDIHHLARRDAEAIFQAMKDGATIYNIFHFHPELEGLGKWERQLIAESLGKEYDKSGKLVHAGITPIVTIGSTDLHSMAQLYLSGPRDKFTLFVKAPMPTSRRVPTAPYLGDLVHGIPGRSPDDIMQAIYGGVIKAYRALPLPYGEVSLPALSAFSLGMYLEWRMLTVILLAELMHVDPFDQPGVERYKTETRKLLGG
jgi:glucose-6-phosphate isomerase